MEYYDFVVRLQVALESLKAQQTGKTQEAIERIDALVQKALMGDETVELGSSDFERLLGDLAKDVQKTLGAAMNELQADGLQIGQWVYQTESAFLGKAPKRAAQLALALDTPMAAFGGASVSAVLNGFTKNEQSRVVNAIRLARHQGKTNSQIKQILRGTRAKRYQDGLLSVSARQAKAIANTAVQHFASEARGKLGEDLGVDKIKVVATLDKRTSMVCRSLDGQILPISLKPPYHVNCRTSFLLWDGKNPKFRASVHGQVKNQTYYQWLAKQSADFQDEVLGKTRGKWFRSGDLTPKKFAALQLDKNFRPRRLDEIRELMR